MAACAHARARLGETKTSRRRLARGDDYRGVRSAALETKQRRSAHPHSTESATCSPILANRLVPGCVAFGLRGDCCDLFAFGQQPWKQNNGEARIRTPPSPPPALQFWQTAWFQVAWLSVCAVIVAICLRSVSSPGNKTTEKRASALHRVRHLLSN